MDRAGKAYWDSAWEREELPVAVDPDDLSLNNYVNRQFHQLFERVLPADRSGLRLLEVGCARSRWLAYFAAHGFEVSGLDYSASGCEQARWLLDRAGLKGEIVEGDMFAPPEHLVGGFDVVVSFGLVEHFTDTAAAQAALARFLKPTGLMLTLIPNLARGSLLSLIQRFINRPVFDVHEPIDRRQLARAHERAGLRVAWCRYFLSANWTVLNIAEWRHARLRSAVMRTFSAISKVTWLLERRGLRLPPNRLTSPYIVAVARLGPHPGRPDA